jgi:hypothetical protein
MEKALDFNLFDYKQIFGFAIIDISIATGRLTKIYFSFKHSNYNCFYLSAFGFVIVNNLSVSLPKLREIESYCLDEKEKKRLKAKKRIRKSI